MDAGCVNSMGGWQLGHQFQRSHRRAELDLQNDGRNLFDCMALGVSRMMTISRSLADNQLGEGESE